MKYLVAPLLVFLLAVRAYSLDVPINGYSSSAPIYTLDGIGTSDLDVAGVHVHQSFTYSMANVNSGVVNSQGGYYITCPDSGFDWDVRFSGNSTYTIKSYGELAVVSFNHKIYKSDNSVSRIRGSNCNGGYIQSSGKSIVEPDGSGGFYLLGIMSGIVIGNNNGKVLQNYPFAKLFFIQTFDLSISKDWANWSGVYSINSNGKVFGSGRLIFGDATDPVDTVDQSVTGTYSKGVYSWTTLSTLKSESKVKLTIKNKDDGSVLDGKNKITAAAQSRKF